MRRHAAALFGCLLVYCAGDFLWLGFAARDFYLSRLGALLSNDPDWLPALLFYPLYACGLVVFCVRPALAAGTWRNALGLGAFFGLVAFATYDLTNLATLKGWPVAVALVDIVWGALVSGLAALAGRAAAVALPGAAAR